MRQVTAVTLTLKDGALSGPATNEAVGRPVSAAVWRVPSQAALAALPSRDTGRPAEVEATETWLASHHEGSEEKTSQEAREVCSAGHRP